jgi:hypothetical protein
LAIGDGIFAYRFCFLKLFLTFDLYALKVHFCNPIVGQKLQVLPENSIGEGVEIIERKEGGTRFVLLLYNVIT